MNRQYLDPVFWGTTPRRCATSSATRGRTCPPPTSRSSASRSTSSASTTTRAASCATIRTALPVRIAYVRQPEHAYTETGWEVHPPSLTRMLLWVTERYGRIPLYITENGAAFYDPPHAIDGAVDDPLRVWYYREHLKAVPRRDRAGRRPPRLLRLEPARQLRVEPRLLQAVRHRARRLRDAGAHAEGERALLPRRDPQQRRVARRLTGPRPPVYRQVRAAARRPTEVGDAKGLSIAELHRGRPAQPKRASPSISDAGTPSTRASRGAAPKGTRSSMPPGGATPPTMMRTPPSTRSARSASVPHHVRRPFTATPPGACTHSRGMPAPTTSVESRSRS